MIKKLLLATGLATAMLAASAAQAAPCAGFNDVDSTNTFCPNVEWLKNRGVTLGCTSVTEFCPADPVSRLAMAAFMQRLGDALLPSSLITQAVITNADVDAAAPPGLTSGLLVCATADLAAATYPRRAIVDINTSAKAQIQTQAIRQRLVVSTNAGVSWTLINSNYFNKVSDIALNGYYSMTSPYLYDIPAAQVVRFAIFLDRYVGVAVAGNDFGDMDCSIRRVINSRTGASSPFDESTQPSDLRN
jgi:hypothetical protein